MNLTLEQVNGLPEKTWRWLGVNQKRIETEIPDPVSYAGPKIDCPAGGGVAVTAFDPACPEEWNVNEDRLFKGSKDLNGIGAEFGKLAGENQNSGVRIEIEAGRRLPAPIVIEYDLDENNRTVIDQNLVVGEKDSEVTVVMVYRSPNGLKAFHGGLTRLYAKENAVIRLIQVQLLGDETWHMGDVGALVEELGSVHLLQAEMGAQNITVGCQARLKGKESSLTIDSIYLGDEERHIDINYIARHEGKSSLSNINVKGALLDHSEKVFRGTIDFKRGASGSKGREEEYAILLSPAVRNRTAPLILCSEDDVDGQHAASTGKMDENKLFYLMSRGLTELDAKKMVIEAEFEPVTEKIPVLELKTAISDQVRKKLSKVE